VVRVGTRTRSWTSGGRRPHQVVHGSGHFLLVSSNQHYPRRVSPASGMGPPWGEFRQQHGTTLPPVMGPPGVHR
jgi:hypothetical protein